MSDAPSSQSESSTRVELERQRKDLKDISEALRNPEHAELASMLSSELPKTMEAIQKLLEGVGDIAEEEARPVCEKASALLARSRVLMEEIKNRTGGNAAKVEMKDFKIKQVLESLLTKAHAEGEKKGGFGEVDYRAINKNLHRLRILGVNDDGNVQLQRVDTGRAFSAVPRENFLDRVEQVYTSDSRVDTEAGVVASPKETAVVNDTEAEKTRLRPAWEQLSEYTGKQLMNGKALVRIDSITLNKKKDHYTIKYTPSEGTASFTENIKKKNWETSAWKFPEEAVSGASDSDTQKPVASEPKGADGGFDLSQILKEAASEAGEGVVSQEDIASANERIDLLKERVGKLRSRFSRLAQNDPLRARVFQAFDAINASATPFTGDETAKRWEEGLQLLQEHEVQLSQLERDIEDALPVSSDVTHDTKHDSTDKISQDISEVNDRLKQLKDGVVELYKKTRSQQYGRAIQQRVARAKMDIMAGMDARPDLPATELQQKKEQLENFELRFQKLVGDVEALSGGEASVDNETREEEVTGFASLNYDTLLLQTGGEKPTEVDVSLGQLGVPELIDEKSTKGAEEFVLRYGDGIDLRVKYTYGTGKEPIGVFQGWIRTGEGKKRKPLKRKSGDTGEKENFHALFTVFKERVAKALPGVDTKKEKHEHIEATKKIFVELYKNTSLKLISTMERAKQKFGEQAAEFNNKTPEHVLRTAEVVALGDAHGDYLNVLEALVFSELATLKEGSTKRLLELHDTMVDAASGTVDSSVATWPFETEEKRSVFKSAEQEVVGLLSEVEWIGGDRTLVLIGDLIVDRGLSDSLTMALLSKIREQAGERLRVLASNHDLEFLVPIAKVVMDEKKGTESDRKEVSGEIATFQTGSRFRAFGSLVPQDDERTNQLMDQYFEHLRAQDLFVYDEVRKVFYMHAPIAGEQMGVLIKKMGFGDDLREEDIPLFVQKVNEWYQETIEDVINAKDGTLDITNFALLRDLVWQRNTYGSENHLPFGSSSITYVYGHDRDASLSGKFHTSHANEPQTIGLDNQHGKGLKKIIDRDDSYPIPFFVERGLGELEGEKQSLKEEQHAKVPTQEKNIDADVREVELFNKELKSLQERVQFFHEQVQQKKVGLTSVFLAKEQVLYGDLFSELTQIHGQMSLKEFRDTQGKLEKFDTVYKSLVDQFVELVGANEEAERLRQKELDEEMRKTNLRIAQIREQLEGARVNLAKAVAEKYKASGVGQKLRRLFGAKDTSEDQYTDARTQYDDLLSQLAEETENQRAVLQRVLTEESRKYKEAISAEMVSIRNEDTVPEKVGKWVQKVWNKMGEINLSSFLEKKGKDTVLAKWARQSRVAGFMFKTVGLRPLVALGLGAGGLWTARAVMSGMGGAFGTQAALDSLHRARARRALSSVYENADTAEDSIRENLGLVGEDGIKEINKIHKELQSKKTLEAFGRTSAQQSEELLRILTTFESYAQVSGFDPETDPEYVRVRDLHQQVADRIFEQEQNRQEQERTEVSTEDVQAYMKALGLLGEEDAHRLERLGTERTKRWGKIITSVATGVVVGKLVSFVHNINEKWSNAHEMSEKPVIHRTEAPTMPAPPAGVPEHASLPPAVESAPATPEFRTGVVATDTIPKGGALLNSLERLQAHMSAEDIERIRQAHVDLGESKWLRYSPEKVLERWRVEQAHDMGHSFNAAGQSYDNVYHAGAKVSLEFDEHGYPRASLGKEHVTELKGTAFRPRVGDHPVAEHPHSAGADSSHHSTSRARSVIDMKVDKNHPEPAILQKNNLSTGLESMQGDANSGVGNSVDTADLTTRAHGDIAGSVPMSHATDVSVQTGSIPTEQVQTTGGVDSDLSHTLDPNGKTRTLSEGAQDARGIHRTSSTTVQERSSSLGRGTEQQASPGVHHTGSEVEALTPTTEIWSYDTMKDAIDHQQWSPSDKLVAKKYATFLTVEKEIAGVNASGQIDGSAMKDLFYQRGSIPHHPIAEKWIEDRVSSSTKKIKQALEVFQEGLQKGKTFSSITGSVAKVDISVPHDIADLYMETPTAEVRDALRDWEVEQMTHAFRSVQDQIDQETVRDLSVQR